VRILPRHSTHGHPKEPSPAAFPPPIRDYPIAAFTEDRELIEALAARGVGNSGHLLALASETDGLKLLAEDAGLPTRALRSLAWQAELAQIYGIGPGWAGRLVDDLHVFGIEHLRAWDARDLSTELHAHRVRVDEETAKLWIGQSRAIELAVDQLEVAEVTQNARSKANRRVILFVLLAILPISALLTVLSFAIRVDPSTLDFPEAVPVSVQRATGRFLDVFAREAVIHIGSYVLPVLVLLAGLLFVGTRLTDGISRSIERESGAEYRAYAKSLEDRSTAFSGKTVRISTGGVIAFCLVGGVLAVIFPAVHDAISGAIQSVIDRILGGQGFLFLLALSGVFFVPVFLANWASYRHLMNYPGIKKPILGALIKARAGTDGTWMLLLILWVGLGMIAAVWTADQVLNRRFAPVMRGEAVLLSQVVEAAAVDAPDDTSAVLAEMDAGLKEGLDEAIQGRGAELRRLNLTFQTALLLLLLAAIIAQALAAIFQFARLRQTERGRGLASALGFTATTIAVPALLSHVLGSQPSLAHLSPFLSFGILLLGVILSFVWL